MNERIRISGLTHIYNANNIPTPALNNITLTIEAGEFVVIQGPSGSGKSTLLHIIAGLDKPTHGNVFVGNKDITAMSDTELAHYRKKYIGIIFQSFALIDNISVSYNTQLPMIFNGVAREQREKKVLNLLTDLGLKNRMNYKPSQLSGGQKQRVAIARALVNEPKIILADEPTGNLDLKTGIEILNILRSLNKEKKKTIILVTHNYFVAKFAERIIYLQDGNIISDQKKSFFIFKDDIQLIKVLSENLTTIHQINILLQMIVVLFKKAGNANRVSIMTFNNEKNFLQIIASSGLSKDAIKDVKLKIGDGVAGEAYKDKKIIYISDTSQSTLFKSVENIKTFRESLISIPIISEKKTLSVITLSNTIENGNPMLYDLDLLKKIVHPVAPAFENISVFQNKVFDRETKLFNRAYIMDTLNEELKKYLENQIPFAFMLIKFKNTINWENIKSYTGSLFRHQDIIGIYKKFIIACIFPNTPIENVNIIESRIFGKLPRKELKIGISTWSDNFTDTGDIVKAALEKIEND